MNQPRRPRPGAQRGAAALIVVLLLFFIVSLVAAYAGRNLIFEQKTSTNQYRATQAFEAAEAGLEWALAMLNGGRIDAACVPARARSTRHQPSFRQRYLTIDDRRATSRRRLWADGLTRERPSCVQSGAGWNCSCPTRRGAHAGDPGRRRHPPGFSRVLRGASNPAAARRGAHGLHRPHQLRRPALRERGEGTAGEAAATVSVVVALSSALGHAAECGVDRASAT